MIIMYATQQRDGEEHQQNNNIYIFFYFIWMDVPHLTLANEGTSAYCQSSGALWPIFTTHCEGISYILFPRMFIFLVTQQTKPLLL